MIQKGKGHSFLCDDGFRNVVHAGEQGFELKVRLTSYRSLPLSCIEGMELKVDGETIPAEEIVFILNGCRFHLADFAPLRNVWWFILDHATLFIPKAQGLSAGEHEVEGTLITVEPYVTAGRFSFYTPSKKRLLLEQDI